jgi:hypothetical protein
MVLPWGALSAIVARRDDGGSQNGEQGDDGARRLPKRTRTESGRAAVEPGLDASRPLLSTCNPFRSNLSATRRHLVSRDRRLRVPQRVRARRRRVVGEQLGGCNSERPSEARQGAQRQVLPRFDSLNVFRRRPERLRETVLGDSLRTPNVADSARHVSDEIVGALRHLSTVAAAALPLEPSCMMVR